MTIDELKTVFFEALDRLTSQIARIDARMIALDGRAADAAETLGGSIERLSERLEQSINRLAERVDRLEYDKLNSVQNDIYSLERTTEELRRDISGLENRVR